MLATYTSKVIANSLENGFRDPGTLRFSPTPLLARMCRRHNFSILHDPRTCVVSEAINRVHCVIRV